MQKYYYNDGVNRFGPFTMEELQAKNISAATPVWYDGLPNWTTAGELEELKSIFSGTAATEAEPVTTTAQPVAEEIKTEEPAPVATPVETTTTNTTATTVQAEPAPQPAPTPKPAEVTAATVAAVTETASAAPTPVSTPTPVAPAKTKPARKKGNPVITYVLSLLVLGGAGYYVFQDIQKNKSPDGPVVMNNTTTEQNGASVENNNGSTTDNNGSTTENSSDSETNNANENNNGENKENVTPANNGNTTTLNPPSKDPAQLKKQQDKQKQLVADAKKKAEDDKKKALEAQKKEEDRKKAQAAKEAEMRNNWTRYVTIGSFTVQGNDRVDPFTIPINNSFPVMVDKVTIRIDYLKKEKKNVGSETLVLNNIPGRSSQSIQAAGNKKAKTANVYITGVTSSQLHFCYPVNNGNAADPYFCN